MKDSDRGRLQQQEGIMSEKAWVAVGDQDNWERGLESGIKKLLQTLKHAYDLWNSRPFLITDQQRVGEVNQIVSGLYHEFAPSVRVLSTMQVQNLYDSKKTYYKLEEEYGLR
jgi:hypothetical protein